VIEHNYAWRAILDIAVSSFTKKLCLVLFTRFGPETREIAHNRVHGIDAPDMPFCRADIEGRFTGLRWELITSPLIRSTGSSTSIIWSGGQSICARPGMGYMVCSDGSSVASGGRGDGIGPRRAV
jgi:hypothetical protein